MTYTFLDVHGFAGGFSLGAVQSGFKLLAKYETSTFGFNPMLANRHLLGNDWEPQQAAASRWPEWDIIPADAVFGNPPCSGFSVLSDRNFRGENSTINDCMWAFESAVARARPKIAIFESVPQAYTSGANLMRQLRAKLEADTGLEYGLYHLKHNGLGVGGAAIRARYFWVVSQVPFGVEIEKPERVPSVLESFGDLSGMRLQWGAQKYARDASWWSEPLRNPTGEVDGHITRSTQHATRMNDLIDIVGTWPNGVSEEWMVRAAYDKLGGKLPESFDNIAPRIMRNNLNMGYNGTFRWRKTRPAYVVTGDAANKIIHPSEPRLLTYREIYRIQGFPDNFTLAPLETDSKVGVYPGKGIPVQCGRWVTGWVKEALDGNPGSFTGEKIGDREWFIDTSAEHKAALKSLLAETEPVSV